MSRIRARKRAAPQRRSVTRKLRELQQARKGAAILICRVTNVVTSKACEIDAHMASLTGMTSGSFKCVRLGQRHLSERGKAKLKKKLGEKAKFIELDLFTRQALKGR